MAASDPVTHSVRVGPATVQVAEAGSGPPLVYLHGAFGYVGWPVFLDKLAQNHTVFAPICPGFGESEGIEHIDDILDLTLFYLDLLDELGLDRSHLVGHFFGSMIAAELASIAGQRVDRLVLASPAGLWLDHEPGVDYFTTPPGELRSVLFASPDSEVARHLLPEKLSDEQTQIQTIERVKSLATVAKFLWPIPDKGLKKRLRRIRRPTLIATGGNDQIVPPAYGVEFADRISGARHQTIQGSGHLMQLERPAEFAELVTDFLND